ncbi:MAG: hypothetical protein RMM17_06435 [Acidobacteriota bacterium]|nr:hypothetical protein [Blastocatellia bacterium]MDW8412301.1 hypothetical protein [Acidobacteriota bacterium]
MHDDHDSRSYCHGFRCRSGCFHIVVGSVMLSLTREQFLLLAEVVAQMYERLHEEVAEDVTEYERRPLM